MKAWKLRKFAGDVVYDLRSRGLLPLAVVLVVAIVAAPLLIARMGSSESAPPAATGALKSASELAPENQAAVLAYTPGVRNYRQRLDQLAAKDPFVQQFTRSKSASEALAGAATASEGAGSNATGGGSGGSDGGSGGSGSGGGKGKTKTKEKAVVVSYQTDLMVGLSGGELSRRNKVPEFTLLPSEQVPVVVFMGPSADGKQAIFSVSRSVTSVSGTGICYPEPANCELLGLTKGQGADLAYTDGNSYRIEVVQIKRTSGSKG